MNMPLSPLEIFRTMGIPSRRVEDWKYTDLRSAVSEDAFEQPNRLGVSVSAPPDVESCLLDDEPLPDWALQAIQRVPPAGAIDAAARAFNPMIVLARVPAGVQCTEPLQVEYRREGTAQIVLLLERGSSLTFLDKHHRQGEGLRNISVSLFLHRGARLIHVRQAGYAHGLATIETLSAELGPNANYHAHMVEGGAKLSRAEWNVLLSGEGANAEISGATVLGTGLHADVTTRIDHATGNTTSRQLFKKVVAEQARAVYQGKITVRKGANGSDSRQTAKAVLLGARAEADLKPELEILADDVKCAHGAAIGDLDASSLFYLRSRGVPESEARSLLLRAFLEEAVDTIEDEPIREDAWRFVSEGLEEAIRAQS
jgi:Fe-S cluster assembly protein SufD